MDDRMKFGSAESDATPPKEIRASMAEWRRIWIAELQREAAVEEILEEEGVQDKYNRLMQRIFEELGVGDEFEDFLEASESSAEQLLALLESDLDVPDESQVNDIVEQEDH